MDLRFQRILRPIAAVTLVFFAWISIEPWNYAVWAQTPPKQGGQPVAPTASKSSSAKFEESLRAVKEAVEDLDKDVASGKDITLQLDSLKGHKQALDAADPEIRAEFAATEKFLKEKKLPQVILNRQAKAVAEYDTNYKTLKGNLDSIIQIEADRKSAETQNDHGLVQSKRNELKAKIKAAKEHLISKVKEPRHQKFDPNNLPNRSAKPTNRKPRLKKEEFKNMVGESEYSPILLAYNGDPSGFLLAQNNQDLPTPEDLAETIEVQFTPDIQAKAAELEHNPVRIYNWVHNNIDFVPTYGSIQGANHCLLTKQCNDMDTASLLIALLRDSGIAARYVTGTIQVPIDQVMNWVGGFSNAQAAINFIGSGGTPVAGLTSGGRFSAARMEHAWVEAYLDYNVYSGRPSQLASPKTWVPLDASFKERVFAPNLAVTTAIPFDFSGFIGQIVSTGTVDPMTSSVTNLDETLIQTTLNAYEDQVQSYIDQNYTNPTINDVFGVDNIQERDLGILPLSLPYQVIVTGNVVSQIPLSLRHKLTLELVSNVFRGADLNYSSYLPELADQKIVVSYDPATANDEQVIITYLSEFAAEIPAYLINLTPVIKINGTPVASGPIIGMGDFQDLNLILEGPSLGTDRVSRVVRAGDFVAVGFNLARVTAEMIQDRVDLQLFTTPGVGASDLVGEMLYQTVLSYWGELDAYNRLTALQTGVISARLPSVGFADSIISTTSLFGVPIAANYQTRRLDIQREVQVAAHIAGNEDLSYPSFHGH